MREPLIGLELGATMAEDSTAPRLPSSLLEPKLHAVFCLNHHLRHDHHQHLGVAVIVQLSQPKVIQSMDSGQLCLLVVTVKKRI